MQCDLISTLLMDFLQYLRAFKSSNFGAFSSLQLNKNVSRCAQSMRWNFHHFLSANNKSFMIIFLPEKNENSQKLFWKSFLFSFQEYSLKLDEIWIVINEINARWKIKPHWGEISMMFFSSLKHFARYLWVFFCLDQLETTIRQTP